eukprot:1266188-Rhodomonas_salina.1
MWGHSLISLVQVGAKPPQICHDEMTPDHSLWEFAVLSQLGPTPQPPSPPVPCRHTLPGAGPLSAAGTRTVCVPKTLSDFRSNNEVSLRRLLTEYPGTRGKRKRGGYPG